MDIGATNTTIKHGLKDAAHSVKLATEIILRAWPHATSVKISDTERLMYRTKTDKEDCKQNGPSPTNRVNQLHILGSDDTVAISHDGNVIIINSIRVVMRQTRADAIH